MKISSHKPTDREFSIPDFSPIPAEEFSRWYAEYMRQKFTISRCAVVFADHKRTWSSVDVFNWLHDMMESEWDGGCRTQNGNLAMVVMFENEHDFLKFYIAYHDGSI